MKELSLNILDLAQNGIKAGAKLINLERSMKMKPVISCFGCVMMVVG
jgi:hypothetical protein